MEKTVMISMPVSELQCLILDCVQTGLKYSPEIQKAISSNAAVMQARADVKKPAKNKNSAY